MEHFLIEKIKKQLSVLDIELEDNSNILEKYRKNMSVADNLYKYVHEDMGSETILFLLKERAVMEGKYEILSDILNFLKNLK